MLSQQTLQLLVDSPTWDGMLTNAQDIEAFGDLLLATLPQVEPEFIELPLLDDETRA